MQVDPFRFAETRRILEGELPLRQMKRLLPLLASDEGSISVALEFGIDEMGVPHVTGRIRASLAIVCQRCLEPMAWEVDQPVALAFLRRGAGPAADEAAIPGPYEPYVVEENPLRLADLIEDEIMLALPQIPRHALEECPARHWVEGEAKETAAGQAAAGSEQTENPFSVLAGLKTPNTDK